MQTLFRILCCVAIPILLMQCKSDQKDEDFFKQPTQSEIQNESGVSIASDRGKALYEDKCLICHQIGNGAINSTGPHLNNLIGRTIGSVVNYRYSDSHIQAKEMNATWNRHNLSKYIEDPKIYMNKVLDTDDAHTRMSYKVRKPEEIEQIVDYISSWTNTTETANGNVSSKCFGVPKHNVDFSGCDLSGVDFSGADLRGANLRGTNFLRAKLSRADLTGADLTGAFLTGADLTEATFESANFTGVSMVKAFLGNTNFDNVIFDNAIWVNGQSCAPGSIGKCNYK